MLIPILLATILIGLFSFVGILVIYTGKTKPAFLTSMISLAAGSLLAVSFLDLLPEAIEESQFEPHTILSITLVSILFFFLFERILHWHHCRCDDHDHDHKKVKQNSNIIYSNLMGDTLHNIVDGFLVAAAFMLDLQTGIIVTLAVIIHEIPQEISDFGILLYAGLSKAKALIFNFVIALSAIAGALLFFFFHEIIEPFIPLIAAFAAGNFIYLATADLIPEMHHETDPKKVIKHSAWLIVGVLVIYFAGQIIPHN